MRPSLQEPSAVSLYDLCRSPASLLQEFLQEAPMSHLCRICRSPLGGVSW
jgi:hypothetical protein